MSKEKKKLKVFDERRGFTSRGEQWNCWFGLFFSLVGYGRCCGRGSAKEKANNNPINHKLNEWNQLNDESKQWKWTNQFMDLWIWVGAAGMNVDGMEHQAGRRGKPNNTKPIFSSPAKAREKMVCVLMEGLLSLLINGGYRPEASLPHQQQTPWKQFIPFGWFAR